MRALVWSLAPMPALLIAYLLAPPAVVGGVALASGAFVVFVVLRTIKLLRDQDLVNRRFTSLVRNASDLVTLIDAETKILFVSPSAERMLGHTPETLEGTSFVERVHPDQAARALEFILGENADDFRSRSACVAPTARGSTPRRCGRTCCTTRASRASSSTRATSPSARRS